MATCPSTTCEPGAVLLGVVGPDGRLRYISPALAIDTTFVEVANQGRSPERRFRFAGTCVESACEQWHDGRCGVIDRVLSEEGAAPEVAAGDHLPHCAVRRTCRWFEQRGPEACAVCPSVITDTRLEGGTPSSDHVLPEPSRVGP